MSSGRAEFTVDISKLTRLANRLDDKDFKEQFEKLSKNKDVIAIVAQAIADNFDKQGPGWKPLKGATIRNSIKAKDLKPFKKDALRIMGLKTEAQVRKAKRVAEFHMIVDKKLERHELKYRVSSTNSSLKKSRDPVLAHRMILQKTGLLKKSVTSPGAMGNINRPGKGVLVWGTDLVYAAVHNYGYPERNIPKREFLKLRAEWERKLAEYVLKTTMQALKEQIGDV